MIAQLRGTALAVTASAVVVDVGGVGMSVLSTPRTLAEIRIMQETQLFTQLVVREDSLTLFGFDSAAERDAFSALQSVSGVGPRLALAMLAVHSAAELALAVESADRAALERVPGIGAKVASRLLLELGGKLQLPESPGTAAPGDARADVIEALTGLGWATRAAEAAVDAVVDGPIPSSEVPETLRLALRELGGSRG